MKVNEDKRDNESILNYLKEHDSLFLPPLSFRVDLNAYSEKLFNRAIQLWLDIEEQDAGFCAIYLNKKFCYITTISVIKKYKGKGGGTLLLEKVKEIAKSNSIREIRLEVQNENRHVVEFYTNFGFTQIANTATYSLKI